MPTVERVKLTAAEFFELPDMDGIVELIDGDVIVSSPKYPHQKAVLKIAMIMGSQIKTGEFMIAPMSVEFDNRNVPQPGIFWVSGDDSRCKLGDDGYWHGAPDFIVEILSPGTESVDRGDKFILYEKYGVYEYWMVQPHVDDPFIEVFTRKEEKFAREGLFRKDASFTSPLFEITFNVSEFFV